MLLQSNCQMKAKWITHPMLDDCVLAFQKNFIVNGEIQEAELYICGLGFFDCKVNGVSLDACYFKPLTTDYEKRDLTKHRCLCIGDRQYIRGLYYNVKSFLQQNNQIEVLVGNGYYQNEERPGEPYVKYGDKKLIFIFRIVVDGVEQWVVSDEDTQVQYLPRKSGLYKGEEVDFTAKATPLIPAIAAPVPQGELVFFDAKEEMLDEVDCVYFPISVTRKGNVDIYDFGINHSGGIACSVRGKRGAKLQLRFAEALFEDGSLNVETARFDDYGLNGELRQRIDQLGVYTLSGEWDEIAPLFSWKGYRYMEVEDPDEFELKNVRSLFIHTKIDKTGSFECSEQIFNDIQRATRQTILCNLHSGLLTDCPHREKRPYTGDGQLIAEAMLYDLDSEKFFDKWLTDICDGQIESGFIPYTVPFMSGGGGYAWSNAIAVIPEWLYRLTGKIEYVERAYPHLVRWIEYCNEHAVNHIIVSSEQEWCLGDWLAPSITEFNVWFMNTICYYIAVRTAEWFAELLHNPDEKAWSKRKRDIADAINDKYFNREKICYCNGIQGENVLPLAFGIVPEEYVAKLKEKVYEKYTKELEFHLDTGIISTPIVIDYLTENGMEEVAFKVMTQTTYPSYYDMLKGETTLSEHWSKRWPDYHTNDSSLIVKGGGHLSHCHPMFGSVTAWLYKRVAGIDLSESYRGILKFTPRFCQYLEHAFCQVKTVFGMASIQWQKEEQLCMQIQVPEGAQGQVELRVENSLLVKGEQGEEKRYIPDALGMVKVDLPSGKWEIKA